ncbi:MAG: type II toxin-antitoxin system CcdA family antitoxin [Hyphomonas sp.]|uniref:type II toxin-antitoxin system CcdA family antitoxin n=1 Tax=Hyphomonas sp. TaxID=87 RepID=UPI0034A0874A
MASKIRVNLTLDAALVTEAKARGLNLSAVSERAIANETRDARMRQWGEENREALQTKARLIAEDGLWSDRLRLF